MLNINRVNALSALNVPNNIETGVCKTLVRRKYIRDYAGVVRSVT